ncbi:MAG: NADH-quinone oxidoreductase subunit L, partial [Verrucomicrobiae bacterium]|nr:NADH-quinone oxidoreductase subunit L [Verrucomicrobiae bacterium]
QVPFILGCTGALFTAFYMTRQVALVFFGSYRGQAAAAHDDSTDDVPADAHAAAHGQTPHESPSVMTVPLIILAVFAILLGFVGTPAWPWFDGYLTGEAAKLDFSKLTEGGTLGLMLGSAVIVLTGITLGWMLYGKRLRRTVEEKDVLEAAQPAVFKLMQNKYYIDELYEHTVIRFNAFAARFCDFLDRWIFGGLVLLVTYVMLGLAWLYRLMDEYLVNVGFDAGCSAIREGGGGLSKLQTGRVQTYLRVIGAALVVLIIILIWGRKA